jgi:hypothetical protein
MTRRLLALVSAFGFVVALLVTGLSAGPANASPAAPNVAAPEMGIRFFPDGDAGQCGGPQQQFAASPDWSTPIRFDTDSRPGGCQFAFGIYDPDSVLTGLSASYSWLPSPGGNAAQCGSFQGTFGMPITPFQSFGKQLRDDTDNRAGWCNLTFTLSGRTDIGLDVQFYADGDPGQCHGALPQGDFYTVTAGSPITLGLDTDNRVGGCWLVLRLRHFGF